MSYVGAAVLPHSPLLLPTIAKDHAMLGDRARLAIQDVAANIHTSRATDLVFLTPHGEAPKHQVVLLGGDVLSGDLKEFGDLAKTSVTPSPAFVQTIRDRCEENGVSAAIQSHAALDYGTIVPWRLLDLQSPPRVTTLAVATLEPDALIRLGRVLHDVAVESSSSVVIIASADLSRRRKATERHDRPSTQERQIAHALQTRRVADLPDVTAHSICGLPPLYALVSSVEGQTGLTDVIATEAPFGVGYITAWLST